MAKQQHTANEQLMLELINRARLDPQGEADRLGIGLNDGLAPGTLSGSSKAPLATNFYLVDAALGHSKWMIDIDKFAHSGIGDGTPGSRITASGYQWNTWGENIALHSIG